jgi:hypothetical protein
MTLEIVFFATERIGTVVIFLHAGRYAESLNLGSEHRHYLNFSYLSTALFATPARQHLDSNNIVARLTLPCTAYTPEEKLSIYTALDESELSRYQQTYTQEAKEMTALSVRFHSQRRNCQRIVC